MEHNNELREERAGGLPQHGDDTDVEPLAASPAPAPASAPAPAPAADPAALAFAAASCLRFSVSCAKFLRFTNFLFWRANSLLAWSFRLSSNCFHSALDSAPRRFEAGWEGLEGGWGRERSESGQLHARLDTETHRSPRRRRRCSTPAQRRQQAVLQQQGRVLRQ